MPLHHDTCYVNVRVVQRSPRMTRQEEGRRKKEEGRRKKEEKM
jgi:hypothetical protein